MNHEQRMEWRGYLIRKRDARYRVTAIRRDRLQNGKEVDNRFTVSESDDLTVRLRMIRTSRRTITAADRQLNKIIVYLIGIFMAGFVAAIHVPPRGM